MEGSELLPITKTVTLRGRIFTVREITIDDLQSITDELLTVAESLPTSIWDDEDLNPMTMAKLVLGNKKFYNALKKIIAQVTDAPVEIINNLGVTKIGRLIITFFQVNDIGEVKELFLEGKELITLQRNQKSED